MGERIGRWFVHVCVCVCVFFGGGGVVLRMIEDKSDSILSTNVVKIRRSSAA